MKIRNKFIGVAAVAALANIASAQVVLDQLPTIESDADQLLASQDFDSTGSFPIHDLGLLDDFTVTASQTNIGLVEAYMQGYAGFTTDPQWSNLTAFRVEFYTSISAGASNLTGDAGSAVVALGSVTRTNLGWTNAGLGHNATSSHVSIPVNVNLPGAGTYWVSVIGVLNEGPNLLQVGVYNDLSAGGGTNATWVNPDGGWLFPGNSQAVVPATDAAYRITAVPEPGSMIALGIGASALLARRRRKKA